MGLKGIMLSKRMSEKDKCKRGITYMWNIKNIYNKLVNKHKKCRLTGIENKPVVNSEVGRGTTCK